MELNVARLNKFYRLQNGRNVFLDHIDDIKKNQFILLQN